MYEKEIVSSALLSKRERLHKILQRDRLSKKKRVSMNPVGENILEGESGCW